jgi:PAS domain S-box-containing protein
MEGRFLAVNDEICRRLGYTRQELLGLHPWDIDEPDLGTKAKEHISTLQQAGCIVFETVHLTKEGTRIPVEVNSRLITFRGEPAIMSTARDITDRKRIEEALQMANRKLNLLSSITRHDIRNKVTIQLGLAALVKQQVSDSPEIAAFIEKIESAAQAIGSQIEFTHSYQDLGTHEPQWQNLHQVLAKTPVKPGLSISDDCAGLEIFADVMLEKSFANLIDNTIRHGGNATAISMTAEEAGGTLVIQFADNGAGIPADEKDRIFERGYGKNTGLGLFLIREVFDLTGITIRETGVPGKGARFEMTVPEGAWRYTDQKG